MTVIARGCRPDRARAGRGRLLRAAGARTARTRCSAELPAEPLLIRTDRGKVRQILVNLVSNAIKFTEQGQRHGQADAQRSGRRVRQRRGHRHRHPRRAPEGDLRRVPPGRRLVDAPARGHRARPGHLEKLRDPAGRRDQGRERSRPGELFHLGLAAGAGGLQSRERRSWRSPSERAMPDLDAPSSELKHGSGRTILLVEDNLHNRRIFAGILTHYGYTVKEAVNGAEAVEMAATTAPDLILMDLSLPVLDGWEATRRIKSVPELQAHPHHRAHRARHGRRRGPRPAGRLRRLPEQAHLAEESGRGGAEDPGARRALTGKAPALRTFTPRTFPLYRPPHSP